MTDYASVLETQLNRALERIMSNVAVQGLHALRKVLNKEGFLKSDYLKDYEAFAHVAGKTVIFEIVLELDAIEIDKDDESDAKIERILAEFKTIKKVFKTFKLKGDKVVKDNRKTAFDRLVEHEFIAHSPRKAQILPNGKLFLSMKRSLREGKRGFNYPKRGHEGIMKEFIDKLRTVIKDEFQPEIEQIIMRVSNV